MSVEEFLAQYKREINPHKCYKFYPLYDEKNVLCWYLSITIVKPEAKNEANKKEENSDGAKNKDKGKEKE